MILFLSVFIIPVLKYTVILFSCVDQKKYKCLNFCTLLNSLPQGETHLTLNIFEKMKIMRSILLQAPATNRFIDLIS